VGKEKLRPILIPGLGDRSQCISLYDDDDDDLHPYSVAYTQCIYWQTHRSAARSVDFVAHDVSASSVLRLRLHTIIDDVIGSCGRPIATLLNTNTKPTHRSASVDVMTKARPVPASPIPLGTIIRSPAYTSGLLGPVCSKAKQMDGKTDHVT